MGVVQEWESFWMGASWEWESSHQERDGTRFFFSLGEGWDRRENPLPCRPLPPTPPRRRHALNLISRSPIHGPHADYISRLFLLAITAADAVADCSEPPSGKSSHPAPSPKRTCSVLTRGSSHPNSKKLTCRCATRTSGETINWRSCNMFFFPPDSKWDILANSSPPQARVLHTMSTGLTRRAGGCCFVFYPFFPISAPVSLMRHTGQLAALQWIQPREKNTHTALLQRDCLQRFLLKLTNNNVMQIQCSLHSAPFSCGLK